MSGNDVQSSYFWRLGSLLESKNENKQIEAMSLTLVKKRIKVLTKHDKYGIIVSETSVTTYSSLLLNN